MLKISDLSENCYKSELDLFPVPPTQTAVESGRWDTILTQGGYEKNPNVDFRIYITRHCCYIKQHNSRTMSSNVSISCLS